MSHALDHPPRTEFDFHQISVKAAQNEPLKNAVMNAVWKQYTARQANLATLPDADRLRTLAGEIKQHTLDHLDFYLEQLKASVERNGGHVHFASTGAEATRIILDIARQSGCTRVIKSKSMVSEEIELAHSMEHAGMDVVETDLGEFIVQISHDKPSHLVAPIVHLTKSSIAQMFSEYFHTPYNDDPHALTRQARVHLREKFRRADFGITGGNFIVAESGHVCVVENEGNARQSTTTPRVLVSLVGIEKLVPRLIDLSVMLKLLARSATGQPMTVYTSLFGGPKKPGEKDGPEEFHLVLMDNGRSEILASEYRETLRCIRCGACLNACPIYRKIGGHAYGSVYPGPIGALITPLFQGLGKFKDLPHASSLCGACYEACPVKINIPKHLINMRRDINSQHLNSRIERVIYRLWAWGLKSRFLYGVIGALQKFDLRRRAKRSGWIEELPAIAAGWTQVRSMPAPGGQDLSRALAKEEAVKCIVQRVTEAQVAVDGQVVGKIGAGMLVLAAVERSDTPAEIEWTAAKLVGMRIFRSGEKHFEADIKQTGGSILLVSNFTVVAATRKGRRPSFDGAMDPKDAEPVFNQLVQAVRALGVPVETGRFGAMMLVGSTNDGPATFVVQTGSE